MKKIVLMMFVILGVTTLQAKVKDPQNFIVEGSFIADKNITYTIFKMDQVGDLIAIEHVKGHKHYFVECNVGDKYVVRFQNKKGDVKFLMIDATSTGYFEADIDWNVPYDGLIKEEKVGYSLSRISNKLKYPGLVRN